MPFSLFTALAWRRTWGAALWLVLAGLAPAMAGPGALAELHTAAEVRSLSAQAAAKGYPVRITGVLTFLDQRSRSILFQFVQDETAGIYFLADDGVTLPPLRLGQRIQIEGRTGEGDFAPIVLVEHATVLGEGTLPAAKPATYEKLARGQEDSQFVEIRGVVRAVEPEDQKFFQVIEVETGNGVVLVYVQHWLQAGREDLVDSEVRVRGVCFTQFNRQRQLLNFGLLVPRPEDLLVERAAAADPFALPDQPISTLLQYDPNGAYGHLKKVSGTVLLRFGNTAYLQDQSQGISIHTRQTGDLRPGDRVEVVGFPMRGNYVPSMENARFRVLAPGTPPPAKQITVAEALEGEYECRLVSIEGTLLERVENGREAFLVLQREGTIFQAGINLPLPSQRLQEFANGSRLRVTGVCVVQPDETWTVGEPWRGAAFRILLGSAADVQVLSRPSWWTLRKLLLALAALGAVVLGAFAWVAVLRRRVSQQTTIIREQLASEAALKERYRELFENASDMVFTCDPSGRLTSINRAGELLLDRNRDALTGRNLLDLVAAEHREAARHWLESPSPNGESEAVEWHLVNASGGRVRFEINTRRIATPGKAAEIEGIGRDITERNRLEREILELSTRERQRIGHDLHDGVCQELAAIAYRTHILGRRLEAKGITEHAEAAGLEALINDTLVQIRGVARGLFPVRLERDGLASALEEAGAGVAKLFKIRCRVACDPGLPAWENPINLHLYYIAQEALLNAARHSGASELRLQLHQVGEQVALEISDNGCGFNTEQRSPGGMGIGIMRYRARLIGGSLDIKTSPGQGTRVLCSFQVPARPSENLTP
jgi:PAS domain S-box-containing protein